MSKQNIFKQVREELRMTQDKMASALGVRQASVSHYENGTREPERMVVERFIRLCKRRGINMTYDKVYRS